MKKILTKVIKRRERRCAKNVGTIDIFQGEKLNREIIKKIRENETKRNIRASQKNYRKCKRENERTAQR